MKKEILICVFAFILSSCKTVDYDWEDFELTATPRVTMNTAKSALPTEQTAKVSFFNLADPDFASTQEFEWELDYYDAEGRAVPKDIEVYVNFYRSERIAPVYPIVLSVAGVFPNQPQFPLPSKILPSDILYKTVTSFPQTYNFTPQQLADITGIDLSTVRANDYFLFKFVVTMEDGQRIVLFDPKSCDETRGELCDCRVGARFKNML
jgi:hypothetical protein